MRFAENRDSSDFPRCCHGPTVLGFGGRDAPLSAKPGRFWRRAKTPRPSYSTIAPEVTRPTHQSGQSAAKFRQVANFPLRGLGVPASLFFGRAAPLSAKSARFCVFRKIAILTISLVVVTALPFSVLMAGLPLYQRNLGVFGENQTRSDPLLYHSAVGSEAHTPKWALRGEIPQGGEFAT